MKKKFLTNLILLIVLNLLVKPFWFFGIEVGVQNSVGEEMYGFYFSLFNFALILNILLDIGITNFNNRAIARNHDLLQEQLESIVPLKFLLSIFYAILAFGIGWIIGYDKIQFKLLSVLILNQFLSSFILFLRSNISGLQLFTTDSILSVVDRTIMIILNSLLLWGNILHKPYQIEWFVYTQTISYSLTLLIVLSVVLFHSGKIKIRFSFSKFKNILRKSYPFAVLILLMSFFNRADSVMLERLLDDGKEQAGIYAQSFRVLDALSQFSLLFAGLLLPMFSRMLKKNDDVGGLTKIAASILLTASITVAVTGIFFNEEILTLMYHEVRDNAESIFSLLMFGFSFVSISYVFGTLLTANRNLKQLNILAAITVVLNFTLNLILIPRYKALGAAIASLSSQGFYAIAQVILSSQILKLKANPFFILRIGLFSVFIASCAYLLKTYLDWIPAILFFFLFSLICSMLTGILKPKYFLNILREKE